MAFEKMLKKSVLGGFKKEGVLNYIEQLQNEIVTLKKDLNENSVSKDDFEQLENDKKSTEKTLEELRAENLSLKDENANLIEKNAAYTLKMEEAQVSIEDYESKLKNCEEKIYDIEAKFAEIEKRYSRIGDADRILRNAKASVTEMALAAKSAIDNAQSEILLANESIKMASDNLINILSDISEKIDCIAGREE